MVFTSDADIKMLFFGIFRCHLEDQSMHYIYHFSSVIDFSSEKYIIVASSTTSPQLENSLNTSDFCRTVIEWPSSSLSITLIRHHYSVKHTECFVFWKILVVE